MLHALVNETKNQMAVGGNHTRPLSSRVPLSQGLDAPLRFADVNAAPLSPEFARRLALTNDQSAYGNQAVLRMLNHAGSSKRALQRKSNGARASGTLFRQKDKAAPAIEGPQQQPKTSATDNEYFSKECWAASELVALGLAQVFGDYAHQIAALDYCLKMGCSPKDNYFDKSDAGPIDSGYVSFIIRKNKGKISPWKLDVLKAVAVSRPDMLTDTPSRKEFYEVKPNSASGLAAGQVKLTLIDDYMRVLGLPYTRGTAYTPSEEIILGYVPFGGGPLVRVSLELKRVQSGLIAYKVCFLHTSPEFIWEQIKEGTVVIAAFILALIALITLKGRVPSGGGLQPEYGPVIASAALTGDSESAGDETA